jgi:hypothetical protein
LERSYWNVAIDSKKGRSAKFGMGMRLLFSSGVVHNHRGILSSADATDSINQRETKGDDGFDESHFVVVYWCL